MYKVKKGFENAEVYRFVRGMHPVVKRLSDMNKKELEAQFKKGHPGVIKEEPKGHPGVVKEEPKRQQKTEGE